ncbi:DUF1553 domain-containing protein [Zavarzinella formosa]|uniref:DUF1553 domain-containing protein n=1 Tax=Zavarzinella formosa TaxID=360055 RepID=UPI000305CCA0|nr:PSD1 and planctomycete cytochrome C domain-containing protein [Zavarzinella formosa]
MRHVWVVSLALVSGAIGFAAEPKLSADRQINFDKDVKPIFAAHCVQCHGPEKQKGSLRLDDSTAVTKGGNSGPAVVPGKSADSLLIQLVSGLKPDEVMPPGKTEKLTKEQIGILRMWIDQGAKWGTAATGNTAGVKSSHWAFQAPVQHPVPKTKHPAANAIDAFIRARLEKEGTAPSPMADKHTLVRRLYLDLIGLPPSPKEVDEFVNDPSEEAYEKLVERLLSSPHYGERWGRHWLDAARYADSDGYEKDTGRPFAWRYRDWVIQALNKDMPFDQFTIEQLAGDLLPDATTEQKAATGFHRNTLTNKEGGVDQEEFRVAAVIDRVNTTGTVWLGLTVGCCQCHDHKYDPVSQREFYQLFAFFNSDKEADLPAFLPGEEAALKDRLAAFTTKTAELKKAVEEAKQMKMPAAEIKKREAVVATHLKTKPEPSKVQTLAAGPARATHVHIRGDFLRKGVEVKPGTPAVLPKPEKAPSTRLDLAKWIVSKENPLTPRVTVNWVWGKFFGKGLVNTPEDFGTQGQKPSHPELLDWLATTFRDEDKWSLKKLHKRIVMSQTYRQSSATRTDLIDKDPLNVLLARQSRFRLEAEIVRDSALAASGLLTRKIGGPSIRPPQPSGISELTYANSARWVESKGEDKYKRGLYVWFQRTSPYPTLTTFDATDSNVCAVKRERSNTPLQALTLLNDAVFVEAAQALAKRVQTEDARPAYLFKLCMGREPSTAEAVRLVQLLKDTRELALENSAEAVKLLGSHKPAMLDVKSKNDVATAASWVLVARALLNLDEFVTRE